MYSTWKYYTQGRNFYRIEFLAKKIFNFFLPKGTMVDTQHYRYTVIRN